MRNESSLERIRWCVPEFREKMVGGAVSLLITGITAMWFLQTAFKDDAPPFVKTFWDRIIAVVWRNLIPVSSKASLSSDEDLFFPWFAACFT